MRRLPPALPALFLAGCASAPLLAPRDLERTTWAEFCPDPQIQTAFVRFEPGGALAWSYEHPDSTRADTVHSWSVRDDTLFVAWANGTAGTAYTPTADPATLSGPATFCPEGATLKRVR